jgi:hypothetical protein
VPNCATLSYKVLRPAAELLSKADEAARDGRSREAGRLAREARSLLAEHEPPRPPSVSAARKPGS